MTASSCSQLDEMLNSLKLGPVIKANLQPIKGRGVCPAQLLLLHPGKRAHLQIKISQYFSVFVVPSSENTQGMFENVAVTPFKTGSTPMVLATAGI